MDVYELFVIADGMNDPGVLYFYKGDIAGYSQAQSQATINHHLLIHNCWPLQFEDAGRRTSMHPIIMCIDT